MIISKLNKPGLRYRPLRIDHWMCHDFNFASKRLHDLKSKGYGGVVTNVAFTNYMLDEAYMNIFRSTVTKAKEEGMRVWIYDENGYPSGTAGGLTIKSNPDYEAKAIASIIKRVNVGEEITINSIYKHEFLYAYALPIDAYIDNCTYHELFSKPEDVFVDAINGEIINLDNSIDENFNLTYKAEKDCIVCYYATKNLYEGTHAQHNVCASRRYISVISKEAIKEFINNTYEKYTASVGDLYGSNIEAFFTDEPSFMTGYLNEGLYPKQVDDEYDNNIPLLPIVPWEPFIVDEFNKTYNYSLLDNLHYLFAGTNKRAQKVRYDFLSFMSNMYYDSFFKQIGDYCEGNNINFSGHCLLEENILHHAVYEGNLFKLIGKMGYPGIDMLTTIPEEIVNYAATPKLVSSSAKYHNKPHVMTETSGHNQGARNISYGIKEMLGSAGTQFALGIDMFTSYYNDNSISEDDNNLYCTYVARLCELFEGGKSDTKVAVYYPIESAWIATKGSGKQLYQREYGEGAINMERSWLGIIDILLRNQIEFDCLDTDALSDSGNIYDCVIIPKVLTLPDKLIEFLKSYAQAGKCVVFNSASELTKEYLDTFKQYGKVYIVDNIESIPENIKEHIGESIELTGIKNNIIYRSANCVNLGYKKVCLFVNTSITDTSFEVIMNNEGNIQCYNHLINSFEDCNVLYSDDLRAKISLNIGGYMSKIICIN